MYFKISAKVTVLCCRNSFNYKIRRCRFNAFEDHVSMFMLFRQKHATYSGKNPHQRAIEKACAVKHF
jgi:hypothetical protein